MGTSITVRHLAVVPPSFFNVLAERASHLLSFSSPSVDRQMRGLESRDLSLMQSDDEALARQINVRHFLREQGPVERKLPVARIESFNNIVEQGLFAIAAVRAGAAGRQAQRDLSMVLNGQQAKVKPERQQRLSKKLAALAALPKSRVRVPGGAQHLLANPVEELLQQTEDLNYRLLGIGLCAYAPNGADLSFPNATGVKIDREDALAMGGMVQAFVQRDLIAGQQDVNIGLSFSHLRAISRHGSEVMADLGSSRWLPKTELVTGSGAHYLVSNSPEGFALALGKNPDKSTAIVVMPPRNALM